VARFFDIDDANAALSELRSILTTLRDERTQLIALRDEFARQTTPERGQASGGPTDDATSAESAGDSDERRRLRLRMQGVIDQMQAGVARIDELGVTLREIETGLIDFPALVNGRQVWLCWRLGDDDVAWWHELSEGFSGRRPLAELS
jgi:hypothetical protein